MFASLKGKLDVLIQNEVVNVEGVRLEKAREWAE